MNDKTSIAVVGATGVVGRELIAALLERDVPSERITLLASERSEGEEVEYGDDTLPIEKAQPDSFRGVQLALFAIPPDAAKTLVPAAQQAGAAVVDTSPAFRSLFPLVLPGFNDQSIPSRAVSVPGAPTAALIAALDPLKKAFGLSHVDLTVLLSASSAGTGGVKELEQQTTALLSGKEPEHARFAQRLGFNLIPQAGDFAGDWTIEEQLLRVEALKLWGDEPLVHATAVLAPYFYGCCLSISALLNRRASTDELRATLKSNARLKLLDSPAERIYPMPMLVTADPTYHVGRVRADGDRALLFVAVDNAGRAAAHNAVEIGEKLTSGT